MNGQVVAVEAADRRRRVTAIDPDQDLVNRAGVNVIAAFRGSRAPVRTVRLGFDSAVNAIDPATEKEKGK